MSDFEVRFTNLDGFVRKYANAERIVREEMVGGIRRIVLAGEALSKKFVRTDTHNLQRSITSTVTQAGGDVRGVWGTNVSYGKVIEFGRRPGAAMPPAGALIGWMRRHGIDASAEFVVRRAIGAHGIKAVSFMKRALTEIKPAAHREMEAVVQRIIHRLAA